MDTPRKRGRPDRGRTVNINHRCTPAWRAWVNAFAEVEGLPVPDVLARAMDFYSRHRRFRPPPDR